MPEPVPLELDVIVSHEILSTTVHAQPAPVVTLMVPVFGAAPTDAVVGEIAYVQLMPAWFTVNVNPAIVIVPERPVLPVLAAMLYETVPAPVPLAPEVIVIHGTLLAAFHAQPGVVPTDTVPVRAAEVTDELVGVSVYTHVTAGAPWLTVNVCPAIVIVPVLAVVPVLAATLYATVPEPVPLAPDVTVIQGTLLVASQAHPAVVVTATFPVVALELIDELIGLIA